MNPPLDPKDKVVHTIVEITQAMINTASPEEVLKLIQETVISNFEAAGCSIGLLEEETGWLAFVAMEGSSKTDQFRVPPGRGISGWVVKNGKGVLSNDPYNDERFFNAVDRQTGFVTHSLMCVPLLLQEKTIGVIQALNTRKTGGFTEEDLLMLATLGELAGATIARTRKFGALRSAGAALQEEAATRYKLVEGDSSVMQRALQIARTVAQSNTTVLLMSESGTGKEVIARAIHRWSQRASYPFIAVNCVALTQDLLASELFGHEKGAFTGATGQKKGKFESADGGTIFLDEIGDLSMDLQVKLLRVLQDREFQRVGGSRDIRADVRIIAATNRNLKQAISDGSFREDLYYRLNVITISLPPLRDRMEDLEPLVNHFVYRFCREMSRPPITIDDDVMRVLKAYHWPGNVRELQNVVERAVVLSPGGRITTESLPLDILVGNTSMPKTMSPSVTGNEVDAALPLAEAVEVFKRMRIQMALASTGGNQSQAARLLGVQPPNLSRMLKKMNLKP